jgi:hypothetical protein
MVTTYSPHWYPREILSSCLKMASVEEKEMCVILFFDPPPTLGSYSPRIYWRAFSWALGWAWRTNSVSSALTRYCAAWFLPLRIRQGHCLENIWDLSRWIEVHNCCCDRDRNTANSGEQFEGNWTLLGHLSVTRACMLKLFSIVQHVTKLSELHFHIP